LAAWNGAGKWRNFGYDPNGSLTSESRHDGSRSYDDKFGELSGVHVNGKMVANGALTNCRHRRANA